MSSTPKIYVAGHRGMVGTLLSALVWQAKINLEQGLALAYQDFKHQIGL